MEYKTTIKWYLNCYQFKSLLLKGNLFLLKCFNLTNVMVKYIIDYLCKVCTGVISQPLPKKIALKIHMTNIILHLFKILIVVHI